jgi:type VI secretion system protein
MSMIHPYPHTRLAARLSKRLIALSSAGLLAACSLFGGPKTTTLEQVKVVAEINANQNSATELDMVFVYDTTLTAQLPKTGPEWFDTKAALMAGMATGVDVVSLQIPPATLADMKLPERHGKAIGVYVFTNYLSTAGQPMSNLTPYKKVIIWLTPSTVMYRTQ